MKIASEVIKKQNKPEMLRRALERIIQLYTDKSHFVYELLQNAEDAGAESVRFEQFDDRLEVYHDGKPFTVQNLSALCDIGKSDKIHDLNQIGEFGVGFKSVFGICETVQLYSNPHHYNNVSDDTEYPSFAVEIKDFTNPIDIPQIEIPNGYTTKFVFPYSVGFTFSGFKTINELNFILSRRLANLGITTLLFMKNLTLIEYRININGNEKSGEYLLDKQVINDHCALVSALGESGNTEEEISYLTFSRAIDPTQSNRTIDIAFPVIVDNKGNYEFKQSKQPYISVYFPTETESKLNFIIQGPYRTTPNRSSVPADDEDNITLAKQTAKLYYDSIIEMRNAGLLNMSLLRLLPINTVVFENYSLFSPLYDVTKKLFDMEQVLPCKNGGYTCSKYAKIVRNQELAEILDDARLTSLLNDGKTYKWLPTILTETNVTYKGLYAYLTSEINIEVIRPDGLGSYFNANKKFLPQQSDEWLSKLYTIFESISAAFNKRGGTMLSSEFIKTENGNFIAPYHRDDNGQYHPNVFLPILKSDIRIDAEFVNERLYKRHQHFFEEVLHLQKPNEFDYFIKDISKRYQTVSDVSFEQHLLDVKALLKFRRYPDYQSDIEKFLRQSFSLICIDRNTKCYIKPASKKIFFSKYRGVNIQGYFSNIANYYYVDFDFYQSNSISEDALISLGVNYSIIDGEQITHGEYRTGNVGKQPHWETSGDFRWHFTLLQLEDALKYISANPHQMDSILKSQTIFKLLQNNEKVLQGRVYIGGTTPDIDCAYAKAVTILRRQPDYNVSKWADIFRKWDGKWLYTANNILVSQTDITSDELSTDIYGTIKHDSELFKLLGFKEDQIQRFQQEYDKLPTEQKQSYFEFEFQRRYRMSVDEFEEKILKSSPSIGEKSDSNDTTFVFPIVAVRNWNSLRKHSADMLLSANPVVYENVTRSIRTSNSGTQRAYIKDMYRDYGTRMYACQMCHKPCQDVDACGIELKPAQELDPMYLCLCPNCRAKYIKLRNDTKLITEFTECITRLTESDISGIKPIEVSIDNEKVWFAHTHIGEIRELLLLESKCNKKTVAINQQPTAEKVPNTAYTIQPTPIVGKKHVNHRPPNQGEVLTGKHISITSAGFGTFIGTVKSDRSGLISLSITEGTDIGQTKTFSIPMSSRKKLIKVIE